MRLFQKKKEEVDDYTSNQRSLIKAFRLNFHFAITV
jgi:hypothetical protein